MSAGLEIKESEIRAALDRQEKAINNLFDTANKAESRLNPILKAQPSIPGGQSDKKAGDKSPLFYEIDGKADRLHSLHALLMNILDRCEL